MKQYNDFFEFWNDRYNNQPEWVKKIALDTWDICVNNFPDESSEIRKRALEDAAVACEAKEEYEIANIIRYEI